MLAGRAADIQDVSLRLLCRLAGIKPELPKIEGQTILVAEDIPPSVLINLDRSGIAGFATVLGGPTSHVLSLLGQWAYLRWPVSRQGSWRFRKAKS